MGDCVPTPTATQFATNIATTLQTTTLLSESTLVSVETGSFPSTICPGAGGDRCTVAIITYRITSTSTTFVPIATSAFISQITNIIPQQTLFAPCGSLVPNGGGQAQNNNPPPNAALIGGVIAAVVTLCVSVIGFIMWNLWRKNRAMKAALAECGQKEDEVNMAQFLPTPYPLAPSAWGPNVTDAENSPTLRNPLTYDHSAYTHQQGVPGSLIPSMYSSTDPEPYPATTNTYTHTRTNSLRPSTAGSQTHSIATIQPPGPSGVVTVGHPQRVSVAAEAKGREALRTVNITEEVEVDPEDRPSGWTAPPPAYSREGQ